MTWNLRKGRIAIVVLVVIVAGVSAVLRWAVFPPPRLPTGAIFIPRDVPTLEGALRQVRSGGTIVLEAREGPFAGSVVVDVPGITICSLGAPATLAGAESAPALSIQSDDVTVRNLEITSPDIGIAIRSSRSRIERVLIRETPVAVRLSNARDCILSSVEVEGGQIGLELNASGGNAVQRLIVRNASEVGVKIAGSWRNTFERLTIVRGAVGVSLEDGSSENEIVDSQIESCSAAGVEMRASSENTLTGSVVRDAHTGVLLDRVTGAEVRDCTIERCASVAVSLQRSLRNRILENRISASGRTGILLSQSAENTLSDNMIRDCLEAGIQLETSDRNLLMRNELIGSKIGVLVKRSGSCRILRNTFANRDVGIVLEGATGSQVFDNRVSAGRFGIALVSADRNVVLRNSISRQSEAGLVLAGDSKANSLAGNRVNECTAGILIAAWAPRSDVRDNTVSGNDIGMLFLRTGPTLRVEGNYVAHNGIGLRQADSAGAPFLHLELLGANLDSAAGETSSPILVNNTFCGNRKFDVENETESPLYAAENWWGRTTVSRDPATARVSTGVRLQESTWKGTIAIGTGTGNLESVLGHVLKTALADAGYRVVDLIGIGNVTRVWEAVEEQDVDVIWWGTADLDRIAPDLNVEALPIPARQSWVVVVPNSIAERLTGRSLSDLSTMLAETGETLRWAVPRAVAEKTLEALLETYALNGRAQAVDWTETPEETETLLRFGVAQCAILQNLEETATLSGYAAIEDDRNVFGAQDIVALLQPELLVRYPGVGDVLSRLQPRLTSSVLHDLISRVRLLHQDAAVVAREFLGREGLLVE